METYWVSCKKNIVNKSSSVRRTKNNPLFLSKSQETSRLELH